MYTFNNFKTILVFEIEKSWPQSKALYLCITSVLGGQRIKDFEITVTNNEIKDIVKTISSLENRSILFKGVTKKKTI